MVSAPLAPSGAVGGGGEVPGACAICPPLLAASRSNCMHICESGHRNHSAQLSLAMQFLHEFGVTVMAADSDAFCMLQAEEVRVHKIWHLRHMHLCANKVHDIESELVP